MLIRWLVCLLIPAMVARAQDAWFDYGVAAEVVRSLMSDNVGQSILGSTNLMANYRNFALEQEMAQEAARRGLTERIDVRRAVEDMRREILIRALKADVVRTAKPPTDDAIEKEYKSHADKLMIPPALKLDVYSISAAQTQNFERAKALLAEGADATAQLTSRGFVHVSGQMTEPWFSANQVAAPIWQTLLEMANGDAEVFPDGNNVLLIKKVDARESRPATIEEARDVIRNKLLNEAREKLWDDFVAMRAKELGL